MLLSTVTNSIMAALRFASIKLFLIKCENSPTVITRRSNHNVNVNNTVCLSQLQASARKLCKAREKRESPSNSTLTVLTQARQKQV